MKKSVMILFAIFISFIVAANSIYGSETCYEVGYRFGLCATQSMLGIPCKPENDIVIPTRCREKDETKKGIEAGVKAVYDTLNLNKGSSSSPRR